jgi:hypothetical protein
MNKQKLVLVSKTMLLIFRILFGILVLMVIIPWTFPNSAIGKFILSIQNFNSSIDRAHKNIDNFMLTLTPLSHLLGFIGSVIATFPLLIGTLIMLKVVSNYGSGNIFTLRNAKFYRLLGIIYLLDAVLLHPLSDIFFILSTTISNPVGHRMIGFSFTMSNLTAIFVAIVLILIGHVMVLGQRIEEEQELTV